MAGLDELGALLFNGTGEKSVAATAGAPQTTIIDGAIYAADDLEDDDYEFVSLTDDDDVNSIDEDEELEDPEDEEDIIYWTPEDDDAVGEDE